MTEVHYFVTTIEIDTAFSKTAHSGICSASWSLTGQPNSSCCSSNLVSVCQRIMLLRSSRKVAAATAGISRRRLLCGAVLLPLHAVGYRYLSVLPAISAATSCTRLPVNVLRCKRHRCIIDRVQLVEDASFNFSKCNRETGGGG